MNKLQLVTFDLMQCLIRPRRLINEVYAEVAASYGVELHPQQRRELRAAFIASYRDRDSRYPCFGANSNISEKDWWRQVVIQSFRNVGVCGQSQVLDRVFNDLFLFYATPDAWVVDAGVKTVLPELWRSGVKIGLIANWDSRIFDVINALGISKWLHFVVTSSQSGFAKPSPDIFEEAAKKAAPFFDEKTLASLREYWLHIGSDWTYDVAGAKAAGIRFALRYYCDTNDQAQKPVELTAVDGVSEVKQLGEVYRILFHEHLKKPIFV